MLTQQDFINLPENYESVYKLSLKKNLIREDIKLKYSLTDLEIFILQYAYIGFGNGWCVDFDYINIYLRNGGIPSNWSKVKINNIVNIITTAIRKFPIQKTPIYRIVKAREDNNSIFTDMLGKGKWSDNGFMSCTKTIEYIKRAKKTVREHSGDYNAIYTYIIEIKKQELLCQCYDISELSISYKKTNLKKTEKEVVFLPGFEHTISKKETKDSKVFNILI